MDWFFGVFNPFDGMEWECVKETCCVGLVILAVFIL